MIEFLTLFLGLYSGVQEVHLAVDETVERVELRLDGEDLGSVSGPPWAFEVDLGEDLAPHELVAVARDAAGHELGRARRRINLELAPADGDSQLMAPKRETTVAIQLGDGVELPPIRAMQSWFTADGEPLEVLRVDDGPADVVVVRDPAAQPYLDLVAKFFLRRELNVLPAEGNALLEGWDETDLSDEEAFVASTHDILRARGDLSRAQRASVVWKRWNHHLALGADVNLRIVSPRAAPVSRISRGKEIFTGTQLMDSEEDGLLWHSARVRPMRFSPRIADAVAMAGLEASVGERRRAVLLLVTGEEVGPSRYAPAAVRAYFEALGVPLFVWAFDGEGPFLDRPDREAPSLAGAVDASAQAAPPSAWGEVRTITYDTGPDGPKIVPYLHQIEQANRELRHSLRRQRIVWLGGSHLPDRIRLADDVVDVRLAGDV